MIRVGDRVRETGRDVVEVVRGIDGDWVILDSPSRKVEPGACVRVCRWCSERAVVCEASGWMCRAHADPRPYACPCVCGADLAAGDSHGIWTVDAIACEYRTCLECRSTRAYMPANHIEGRVVNHYPDEATSEAVDEWENFLDALADPPVHAGATLVRNGVVLARTYCAVDGTFGWMVQAPRVEEPCRV